MVLVGRVSCGQGEKFVSLGDLNTHCASFLLVLLRCWRACFLASEHSKGDSFFPACLCLRPLPTLTVSRLQVDSNG